ncbi:MAG TPA: hypothetical protein VEZ55_06715 [Chitinophagaceae bacterium]|nr:hypothetical protein [Chitinophagaceae bacterium]
MKRTMTILLCCMLSILSSKAQVLTWQFPINRTHAGMLLGNGVQGLMVWGDSTLNITVGRAGFWDHRGGNDFASRASFDTVKQLVAQKDEAALRKLFTNVAPQGQPNRPQHFSAGVWKIRFPKNYRPSKGLLNLANGNITIQVKNPTGKIILLQLQQSVLDELSWIDLPAELQGKVQSEVIPMWQWNKESLQSISVAAPQSWKQQNIDGFTQTMPQDLPLAMAQRVTPTRLLLSTNVSDSCRAAATRLLQTANVPAMQQRSAQWWRQYWGEVARIRVPDPALQEMYDYGVYKQACSTPPHGIACTLQGPFMEEYQFPPWNNDYHFNINEQLIYAPALTTNRTQHFKPLLQLIDSLLPVFRRNGKLFFKNPAAIMFPHAVDDRGQAIGDYWGGTIDHATTAWVAFMTWQYYEYSGDTTYLRRLTYPLLSGAFEGFWSMMEKGRDDKGNVQYSLPVSVSPEYGGGLEGVGKNSSFQLAALHRVLSILPQATTQLKLPLDNRWAEVQRLLPQYSIVQTPYGESSKNTPRRIGLWEGQDLEISHRHHSHLGSIYPFQTINLADTAHQQIAIKSYWRWVHTGAGGWTGWCIPWASVIHNRMGHTEAAVSWLHYWNRNFVNEGRGTLHNATNNGMSVFNEPNWAKEIAKGRKNHEIMQLDAGFGAVTAILDLLVQETPQGIYIMMNRHRDWKDLSFERVRTAGGFLISGEVKNDKVQRIVVHADLGGRLQLHHGLGKQYLQNGKQLSGEKLELEMRKGERLVLEPMQ